MEISGVSNTKFLRCRQGLVQNQGQSNTTLSIFLLGIIVSLAKISGNDQTKTDITKLYIAGNSTAKNGAKNGWGSHLQNYFDSTRLVVDNRARGGRSSRTFITEGLWEKLTNDLKPGDFVLIEFGHNDAGAINDTHRARGSIPALGDEIKEIENMLTGKHEIVHTFGWYMRKMIH